MGISTLQSYCGAQIFEAVGLDRAFVDTLLHRHRVAASAASACRRSRRKCGGGTPARSGRGRPVRSSSRAAASTSGGATARSTSSTPRRCSSCSTPRAPASTTSSRSTRAWSTTRARSAPRCAACSASSRLGPAVPLDEVEPVEAHPAALLDRRDVVRLDQPGSARDAGHRDEPHGRQVEHRRGRRGSGAQRARCQRRLAAQRHQAGGLGPLRRDQRVPGQRRRPADQDGPGRQARRGRPAARPQGLSVDREGAPLHAGRRPDLAAAAPRHLLDRGSGAAHLRPEERQSAWRACT